MPTIRFSANLQKYRKLRHMSQEELAEKLQVTRQAVAKWESGANYPDILNLTMLAGLFGVTVDALIYGIDCPGSGFLSDTGRRWISCFGRSGRPMPGMAGRKKNPAGRAPMISVMRKKIIFIWTRIWEGGSSPERKRSGKSGKRQQYRFGQ